MTLTTPRLVLRLITRADAPAVFAACSDPRLTEHTTFDTHGEEPRRSGQVDFSVEDTRVRD